MYTTYSLGFSCAIRTRAFYLDKFACVSLLVGQSTYMYVLSNLTTGSDSCGIGVPNS